MSHQPNNIFAGTQVVSLVEVRGTNNSLVHPRGAVGVVTRTPAVEGEKFLVRLPDGFEATLEREQLDVLKHFKDRLGACSDAVSASHESATVTDRRYMESAATFDLEQFILYRCIVGSRAYGLDTDESDTDRRGIYLAPAELHWSLDGVPEQIGPSRTGPQADTAETYWELQKFLVMALKANPNILECLHTPLVEHATPLAQELLAARQRFLSKLIYQTYNGYVMSQFKKLEQDLRARGDCNARSARFVWATDSQGLGSQIKWKHAMHLMRLLLSGISALREGDLRLRLGEERDALLTIKRGERPWPDVNAWRLRLHKEFDEAFASTQLPERPDYAWANEFLLKARRKMVTPS